MIKDLLISFKDTMKTKTTNPFFGTLIIVWFIHNWQLIYTLFNFNVETKLESKIDFISSYLAPDVFIKNLGIVIIITFGVLISSYTFLNLSRFIVNFFEKIITPQVYKLTDKSSIVLKHDFEIQKLEKERYEKKYENEKELRLKLQNDYEVLETKYQKSLLIDESKNNKNSDSNVLKIYENLNKLNILEKFEKIIEVINNRESMTPEDEDIKILTRYDLVKRGSYDTGSGNKYYYDYTELGTSLKDFIMKKKIYGA